MQHAKDPCSGTNRGRGVVFFSLVLANSAKATPLTPRKGFRTAGNLVYPYLTMSYRITSLEGDILDVVHTDEMTMEEAIESRQRSGDAMVESGLDRVLVDMSAAVIKKLPDTTALFEFNVSHYDAFPAGCCIACVVAPDKSIVDAAGFAETVALNRGISMRIFTDRAAALAWLKTARFD